MFDGPGFDQRKRLSPLRCPIPIPFANKGKRTEWEAPNCRFTRCYLRQVGGMEDLDGGRGRQVRKTYRWTIVDRQLETTRRAEK